MGQNIICSSCMSSQTFVQVSQSFMWHLSALLFHAKYKQMLTRFVSLKQIQNIEEKDRSKCMQEAEEIETITLQYCFFETSFSTLCSLNYCWVITGMFVINSVMVKRALDCKFKPPVIPSAIHFLTGTEELHDCRNLKYLVYMGTWALSH